MQEILSPIGNGHAAALVQPAAYPCVFDGNRRRLRPLRFDGGCDRRPKGAALSDADRPALTSAVSADAMPISEHIVCFTPGTLIATPRGARPVEALRIGDQVVTRDHGLQPIRWIGKRVVPAVGRFAPVRIGAGAIAGLERDLIVSPQHRVLLHGYRAELLFGESEVLISACDMVDGTAVTVQEGGAVTYIHLMFDEHEIIYADGAATESFHPGDRELAAISDPARDTLFRAFPMLRASPEGYGATARRCLTRHEAQLIA